MKNAKIQKNLPEESRRKAKTNGREREQVIQERRRREDDNIEREELPWSQESIISTTFEEMNCCDNSERRKTCETIRTASKDAVSSSLAANSRAHSSKKSIDMTLSVRVESTVFLRKFLQFYEN